MSCTKAREVLDAKNHRMKDVHDARKEQLDEHAVWSLMKSCDRIVVAKGKAVKEYIPTEENREDILASAMGRSGSLRAPAHRIGRTMVIGFNDTLYQQFFMG